MIMNLEEFEIVGISVRTTNQNGQSQQDIGGLWARWLEHGLMGEIPGKQAPALICLYTDYEDGFNGFYTCILGCKVNSFEKIPPGFTSKIIPAAKYQVFKSIGKLPDCVIQTWTKIWESGMDRKYIADFDLYGKNAEDPNQAEVETYVSIP